MSFFGVNVDNKELKDKKDDLCKTLNVISMEVVSASAPCVLGESPHYCSVTNNIIYVDINGKRILVYDLQSNVTTSMQLSQMVGFAIPTTTTRKGGSLYLIVGLEDRIVEVNFTDRTIIRTIAEVPTNVPEISNSRFNDGKASPSGKLYAGYMHLKWREGNGGHFFRFDENKYQFKTLLDSTESGLSNGLAWATVNDKSVMYLVDSLKNIITMYRTDDTAGDNEPENFDGSTPKDISGCCSEIKSKIEPISIVYTLDDEYINAGGMLDGMTIDNEGKLWCAVPGCSCILRIDPILKKVCYKLVVPIKKPTACTFGGKNLDYLYITARNADAANNEPNEHLWCCKLEGIKGVSAGNQVKINHQEKRCCFPDYFKFLSLH